MFDSDEFTSRLQSQLRGTQFQAIIGDDKVERPSPDVEPSPRLFGGSNECHAYLTFRGCYNRVVSPVSTFFVGPCRKNSMFLGTSGSSSFCILSPQAPVIEVKELASILAKGGAPVVIKNCPVNVMNELRDHDNRFTLLTKDDYWAPECPYDDQTFPEVAVECQHPTRRPLCEIDLIPSYQRTLYRERFREIYSSWRRRWESSAHKSGVPFFSSYYDSLFKAMFGSNLCDLVWAIWRDNQIAGFAAGCFQGHDQVDMWALVPSHGIKSRVVFEAFLAWGYRSQIRYLNLGGSEVESLHAFKLSLGKVAINERVIAIYENGAAA